MAAMKNYRELASKFGKKAVIYSEAQQNSQFVGQLRRALPLATLTILAAVILWPQVQSMAGRYEKIPEELKQEISVTNALENPHLRTLDTKGRPFEVKAEAAHQQSQSKVDFEKPMGKITLEDGGHLKFSAAQAEYDERKKILSYKDNVELETSEGLTIKTNSAFVDVDSKTAEGYQDVRGEGETTQVESQGFKISENGQKIAFKGKTKLILKPGVPAR